MANLWPCLVYVLALFLVATIVAADDKPYVYASTPPPAYYAYKSFPPYRQYQPYRYKSVTPQNLGVC